MLADDVACSPRNPAAGTMLQRVTVEEDIYGPDIQVDFRGIEVTAESVRRVLTGNVVCAVSVDLLNFNVSKTCG